MKKKSLSQRGFTIIEMLVVIFIICILASILLPGLSTAQKKAKIARTQGIIDSITIALKQYRTDFEAYPPANVVPGASGVSSAECVYYFTSATFIAGTNTNSILVSAGPYMEYRQKDKKLVSGHTADLKGDGATGGYENLYEVLDPWGNALIYAQPGTNNTSSFDLHSKGPDGTDANTDDIKNW